jgi:hypothetical protein
MTSQDSEKAERRKKGEAAGWSYFHSESLGLDCAVKNTPLGPIMMTEDKVEYMPDEIAVLRKIGGEVPKSVHIVKKLFGGEIVAR